MRINEWAHPSRNRVSAPVASRRRHSALSSLSALYIGDASLHTDRSGDVAQLSLAPPMVRLQRWGVGKTLSALLVVVIAFSALALICWAGLGQAYTLAQELPAYRQNISSKLRSVTPSGLTRLSETKHMLGEVSGALYPQRLSLPRAGQPPGQFRLKCINPIARPCNF